MPTESKAPQVSVVIATRDRAGSLENLLGALERQVFGDAEFEIVVVDDGSRDHTSETASRFAARTIYPLRYLRLEESQGPAMARNHGWRAARAPIIAFTDDDCLPESGWLAAGLAAFSDGIGVVQGRTQAEPGAEGYGEHFSRTMEAREEDGHYPTCNLFYRREALERAGGFDESFRHACGEDTDLAWRVKALGYESRFSREALVIHEVRPPSFRIFLRERRRFADQILLVKRHPHLRSFYYRRYFYQRSHVHAIAALGLIAVATTVAPPAAAMLPVVWLDRFRHTKLSGSWPHRLFVAAQLLVGDLWELAVFCYCSIRYRSILI
jgi:glycosyltransferase involved in cell wall biosynthesis